MLIGQKDDKEFVIFLYYVRNYRQLYNYLYLYMSISTPKTALILAGISIVGAGVFVATQSQQSTNSLVTTAVEPVVTEVSSVPNVTDALLQDGVPVSQDVSDIPVSSETEVPPPTEAKNMDQEPIAIASSVETEITTLDSTEPAEATQVTDAVATPGTFTAYSEDALLAEGTNVLFFHADWCPSCRGLERDLIAQSADIPANLTILKLDYDSETELKKKYKVIRQHTLVVVDADGNEIKKLTGLTNTLAHVVNQL